MKQVSSIQSYVVIYVVLMILLALTLGSAFLDLGKLNPILNLGIASIKAGLVVFFFMHLKTSPGLTKIIACVGLFWLGVLFTLALSDYFSRGWLSMPGRWPM